MAEHQTSILFWDVDTQIDFMQADGKLYVPDAEAIEPNLARLSHLADDLGIPLVASADDHSAGDPELSDDPDFQETYPPHCMHGTEGVRRVPATDREWTAIIAHERLSDDALKQALTASPPRILVQKQRFDVFTNPNTGRLLAALDPGRIVVYGVALDVCNRYAIDGMLERGYDAITLVTDATKPIHADQVPALLQRWRDAGVEMKTTAEIVADLRKGAAKN
jgi:nicotinamidase/pyrazinamidase